MACAFRTVQDMETVVDVVLAAHHHYTMRQVFRCLITNVVGFEVIVDTLGSVGSIDSKRPSVSKRLRKPRTRLEVCKEE